MAARQATAANRTLALTLSRSTGRGDKGSVGTGGCGRWGRSAALRAAVGSGAEVIAADGAMPCDDAALTEASAEATRLHDKLEDEHRPQRDHDFRTATDPCVMEPAEIHCQSSQHWIN